MYDLARDPLELTSVYKNGRYAPVKKFLLKKLAKLVNCSGADCDAARSASRRSRSRSRRSALRSPLRRAGAYGAPSAQ